MRQSLDHNYMYSQTMAGYLYSVLIVCVVTVLGVQAQCGGRVDLIIAVPGSIQVPEHEFLVYEPRLIELLRHFDIQPDGFNVGLILYGENAVPIAYPQPFKTRMQMNTRVSLLGQRMIHLHKLGLQNNVYEAIYAMQDMFTNPPPGFSGQIMRPGARKVGVIFTYGPSPKAVIEENIAAATAAKRSIMMYALAANGSGRDFPQLGSDYCRLFSMGTLASSLHNAVPDLASGICSEVDPTVYVSENNCFPRRYGTSHKHGVTCQVQGNMIQADPNNCAYYYQCEYFDRTPIRKQCPLSTLYDPLTRNCNNLIDVACYNELTCPVDFPPLLHPFPLDCTKYVNCGEDRIPHVQSCAPGLVFDSRHQTCNDTMGVCITY